MVLVCHLRFLVTNNRNQLLLIWAEWFYWKAMGQPGELSREDRGLETGRNKGNGQPRAGPILPPGPPPPSAPQQHRSKCFKTWAPLLSSLQTGIKVFCAATEVSAYTVWALGLGLGPCWCLQLGESSPLAWPSTVTGSSDRPWGEVPFHGCTKAD